MKQEYRCYRDYDLENLGRSYDYFDVELDIDNFEPQAGDVIWKDRDEGYRVIRREFAAYSADKHGNWSVIIVEPV